MNDFINSLRTSGSRASSSANRRYDVLLNRDVQFFEHKERIQEEFFHTFNSLYEPARRSACRAIGRRGRSRRSRSGCGRVRVGSDHRTPAARPGDAHRDPRRRR